MIAGAVFMVNGHVSQLKAHDCLERAVDIYNENKPVKVSFMLEEGILGFKLESRF